MSAGAHLHIGDGVVRVTVQWPAGRPGVADMGNVVFRSSRVDHDLVAVLGPVRVTLAPIAGHRAELCR